MTGDTREFQWGTGTFASRGAVVAGSACHAAALSVREKILTLGGQPARRQPDELELGGRPRLGARLGRSQAISLGELAAKANPLRGAVRPGTEPGLESTAYFGPDRGSTASGVHAMIVEVDVRRRRWWRSRATSSSTTAVAIINPLLVEGQIHGGVAHGIGNAFYEQLVYDEQGQLLNASFMDYLLPTATDVPPIETGAPRDAVAVQPDRAERRRRSGLHSDRRGRSRRRSRTRLAGIEILEIPLSPNRLFTLIRAGGAHDDPERDVYLQRTARRRSGSCCRIPACWRRRCPAPSG